MLRLTTLRAIRNSLEYEKLFNCEEFILKEGSKKGVRVSTVRIEISYRFEQKYCFVAEIPQMSREDSDYKIRLTYCPGDITEVESTTINNSHYLTRNIESWVCRIHEELINVPFNRVIHEQQEEIEMLISRFEDLPNEYFSKEEVNEIKGKLDELEKKLDEKIQEMIDDKEELELKQQELRIEIESLKKTIEVLKKPGWAGSFMIKLSKLFTDKETRTLLKESAVEVGTQLLIEVGKNKAGL